MKKTAALKLQQQQKIREQIQQLRNIRKMMFDTFEIENQSSQVDQSTEEKTNIGNTKVQDETSKLKADGMQRSSSQSSMDHDSNNSTTLNYDHLYRKLKSTVQLLSESLEEQGNLKALLELTSNLSVYDQVFQSEIFHLSQVLNLNQPPNSKDEPLAISEDLLTNIKFRSLLLEREQLMSKIVDTRTNYEEEKTKRLQTENELKVIKEMLETAQQETEKYQKLYDELHQEYDQLYNHSLVNPLAFSQSQQRQQNRQLPPLTPPAGSSRSRFHFPPSHGHHPQYQPGIVPMDEEGEEEQAQAEEDHDLLDMLDQEDQLEERLPVTSYPDQDHRHHQADRQQPTLFVHDEEVDDINTPVPNYHHPHHPEVQSTINPIRSRSPSPAPVSHSNTNNAAVRSRSTSPQPHQKSRSPSPSSSPVQQEVSPMTYIVLDIDLENNQKDQLIVTLDGDPLLLAYQFMERNNLADSYFLPLSEYIKDTQMQLLENYRRHLEETEEVISRSHSEEGEKISASHVDDDKDPSLLQLDEIHDDEQQEEKEEEEVLYPDRSMRSNQSSSSPLQQQHYSKEEDEELLLSLSLPISRDSRHSNGKKQQQQQREKIDIDLSDQKDDEGEESVDISHLLDDLFLVHPPSVSAEKDTKSKVQKKVATSPKNKKFEVEVERDHDEFVLEEKPAEKLPVAADQKEQVEEEDEENFDLDDLDITLDRSDDLNHEESEDQHHEKKEEMKNDDNEEGYYSDSQDLNEIYNIIKQQQRQIQIQQAKLQDHFDQTATNPMNTKKKNRSQLHPVDRYIQEDLLAHSPSIHHPSTHSIQEMPHLAATGGTGTNPIKGKKISPTTYRSQYEISRNVRLPFSPHPNQLHSHKQLFPAEEEEEEEERGDHDREQPIDQEAEEEDQLSDYHSDNNDIGITDDHELDEDLLAEYENPEEEEVLDYHSDREVEEMKQHLYSPHRQDIVDLSDTGSNANNDQIQEEDQYPFPSEDEDEGERDEDDLLLDQFEEDYLEEDEEEEVVSPIQQEHQPVVEEKKPTPIRRSSQLLIQSVHPVVQSAAAPPPRSTSPKPSGNNNNNKVTTQSPPTGRQQVLPNKNPSTPSADDFRSLASQQQQQQQPGQLLGKNQEYNHLLSNLTENINNMEIFSPMSPMSPFPLDKSISNEEIEEIIEIALEIIQRANELRDAGQFQFAVPLYNNALKLLELSEYYELDHLKEEIMNSLL